MQSSPSPVRNCTAVQYYSTRSVYEQVGSPTNKKQERDWAFKEITANTNCCRLLLHKEIFAISSPSPLTLQRMKYIVDTYT
jgi:hypothetical protein